MSREMRTFSFRLINSRDDTSTYVTLCFKSESCSTEQFAIESSKNDAQDPVCIKPVNGGESSPINKINPSPAVEYVWNNAIIRLITLERLN